MASYRCCLLLLLFMAFILNTSSFQVYECESQPDSEVCTLKGVSVASMDDISSIELPEGQQYVTFRDGNIPVFGKALYDQLETTTNLTITSSGVERLFIGPLLVEMIASRNKIARVDRDSAEDYSSLRVLDLSYNQLDRVPNIKDLTGLEVLDLSYNAINVLNLNLIKRLTHLKVLNVSSNKLGSLDTETQFRLTHLIELRLSNNQLQEVDFGGWELPSLVKLDLSNNLLLYLNGEDLGGPFPKLSFLGLPGNQWNCRALSKLAAHLNDKSIYYIRDVLRCPANYTLTQGLCCLSSYVNFVTLQSQWDIRRLQREIRTMNETLVVKLAAVRDEQGVQIAQLEEQLAVQEQQMGQMKDHLKRMAGLIEDLIEELYLREMEGDDGSEDKSQSRKNVPPSVKIVF